MKSNEQVVNLARELLLERTRRELSRDEQRVLAVLLETSAACRQLESQMSALERFEAAIGSIDVPGGFHASLRARLLGPGRKRPEPLGLERVPWELLVPVAGLLLYAGWFWWGGAMPPEWGLRDTARSLFSLAQGLWTAAESGLEAWRISWNQIHLDLLWPAIGALAGIGILLWLQGPKRQSSSPD